MTHFALVIVAKLTFFSRFFHSVVRIWDKTIFKINFILGECHERMCRWIRLKFYGKVSEEMGVCAGYSIFEI